MDIYKDQRYLKLPEPTRSASEHLPQEVALLCAGGPQKPLNPHRQKLIAAAARKPTVPESKDVKESKPKQAAKSKAKAKAKPAAKAKAKTKPTPKGKAKTSVKVTEARPNPNGREDARVAYNTAKNEFMASLLARI